MGFELQGLQYSVHGLWADMLDIAWMLGFVQWLVPLCSQWQEELFFPGGIVTHDIGLCSPLLEV